MFSKKIRIVLLATALLLSVSFLVVLFTTDIINIKEFGPLIWRSSTSSKEYYVLDSEWLLTHPELKKVLEESQQASVSKSTLNSLIDQHLTNPDNTFLKSLENDVVEKYTDQFKASLKEGIDNKLKEEATNRKFESEVKSYKVEEQLRAQYLEENRELLKNVIIAGFLKDTSDENLKSKIDQIDALGVDRGKYFQNILDATSKFSPSGRGISAKGKTVPSNGLKEVTVPPKSRKELKNRRVKVKPADFSDLQQKHDAYVAFVRTLSVPHMEVYSGDGIVLAAGKKHILGALNVIIQLREMGSELPVELVLDSKADYNRRLCETILPKFNGKCLVIEEVLGEDTYKNLKPDGFPMKVVALVVSSFDNTIFLDSDAFPIKNVDALLVSEPFRETRFVLWPDNWHKGTSPIFYDIVRLTAGEPIRRDGLSNEDTFASYIARNKDEEVLLHDLEGIPPFTGIESGQLVFSKREHFRSLFLSLYYNIHGSSYYYPLLYQGVYGSGDRETFVPALHVMNEPYYITDWEMKFTGLTRQMPLKEEETYFDETTMVQSDPDAAMKFRKAWRLWLSAQGLDSRLNPFQNGEYTSNLLSKFFEEKTDVARPESFFLHVHSPKINGLFNEISTKAVYNYESRYIRKIGEYDDLLGVRDWDLQFQAINMWTTCEAMNEQKFWDSFEVSQKETCRKMRKYVDVLKSDSNDADAANIKVLQKA